MLKLNLKEKLSIKNLYELCDNEAERKETILEVAEYYQVSQMEIRQLLQDYGVYHRKEGKTEKEQYAVALWAVTGIDKFEWMKLSLKAKKAMMEFLKNG